MESESAQRAPQVDNMPVVFDPDIPPDEPMGGGRILGIGEENSLEEEDIAQVADTVTGSTMQSTVRLTVRADDARRDLARTILEAHGGDSARDTHKRCAEGHTKSRCGFCAERRIVPEVRCNQEERLRIVIDVEYVILGRRLDAQVVEQPQNLCTMICAVVSDLEKHLPQDQASASSGSFIGLPGRYRPQLTKIFAHTLLDAVPVCANIVPVVKVSGWKRLRGFAPRSSANHNSSTLMR